MFEVFLSVSHSYGDYPKLPDKSHHERDPWYQWDQPDMRHNWGEPVGILVALFKLLIHTTGIKCLHAYLC